MDQSTKVTGYAEYAKSKLISYGTITSDVGEKNVFTRIFQMYVEFGKLMDKLKPDLVLLENIQFQRNYKVYAMLGQVIGALTIALHKREIKFALIEPAAWKSAAGVKGRKRKEQKQNAISIVKSEYGVDATEDECEAILMHRWVEKNSKKI